MEDTTQRLQTAIAAARAGQLAEARSIAKELTEEDPDNAHAWYLRGILSEDEAQQVEYLDQALAVDPDHKPARKRMEMLRPPAEEEEVKEAFDADMTMVADSAVFAGAVAGTDEGADFGDEPVVEEEAEFEEEAGFEEEVFAADEGVPDTVIAATPFAEEMTPDEVSVEELFGEEMFAEEETDGFGDEELATVFAAASFLGDDEAPAEADATQELTPEDIEEAGQEELDAAVLAAAAADATMLAEGDRAWFEEEADDELWAKVEAEAVPEWLLEDTSEQAEATLAEESLPAETQVAQSQDLPDWLLDEPDEDWGEAEEAVDDTMLFVELEPDEAADATVVAVADEEPDDELVAAAPAETKAPAPARPKKKSANRSLEILLVLLVIAALAVVAALVYFLINPPL